MKLLTLSVSGLKLFKGDLNLSFTARQRVSDDDKEELIELSPKLFVQPAIGFVGINASGKTSTLRAVLLALRMLNNEPLNHIDEKCILEGATRVIYKICFWGTDQQVYQLETVIVPQNTNAGQPHYIIESETLWQKKIGSGTPKSKLTDFSSVKPALIRKPNEGFLSDDVSIVIAKNKELKSAMILVDLLGTTNLNLPAIMTNISEPILSLLDPTIEYLRYEEVNNQKFVARLKFKNRKEVEINEIGQLPSYLSSGTIKGVMVFCFARFVLQNGGYLAIDEVENHFNKEIVRILIQLFRDTRLNKKGAVIVFSTHYPELLDDFERNDALYRTRNEEGISVAGFDELLKRNDVKKSEMFQSGSLGGTAPSYEAYRRLRREIRMETETR